MPQPIKQMPQLPPCPLKVIRKYLETLGFHKVNDLSDNKIEIWTSEDNFHMVRVPVNDDPLHYSYIVAIVEFQLRKTLSDTT
jgi:hypothetical protein